MNSYRDGAEALQGVCHRVDPRDFYDLHVVLTGGEPDVPEEAIAARFAPLLAGSWESDRGLHPMFVGQAVARLVDRSIVEMIPSALPIPTTNREIHRTLMICVTECARQSMPDEFLG